VKIGRSDKQEGEESTGRSENDQEAALSEDESKESISRR
jgi:hypothetical protein